MKLNIGGKFFKYKRNKKNHIIVKLKTKESLEYFTLWQCKAVSMANKNNYTLPIYQTDRLGRVSLLLNCFPIINNNQTKVRISYDVMTNYS